MSPQPVHRARILVIDNDERFARELGDYFGACGYEVAVALNGLDGFRQANCGRYDVIVLDINMPEVAGVEALRAMKLVGQKAKIVVVSGYLTGPVVADCREAGAAAVLAKPVILRQLLDEVRRLTPARTDSLLAGAAQPEIQKPSVGSSGTLER